MNIDSKYKILGDIMYISKDISILPDMFANNNSIIKKVVIPKNIVYIGKRAFSFCNKLEEVIFEDDSNCKFLCDECFDFCSKLKQINIPDCVEYIGSNCFRCNNKLGKIVLPRSIKNTGEYAFCGSGIKKIKTHKTVIKNIDNNFFDRASVLEYVEIGEKTYSVSNWENKAVIEIGYKILNDISIITGKKISDVLSRNKTLWFKCTDKNKNTSYSTNLRTAYMETLNKASEDIRSIAIRENWTLDKIITIKEYSLMSGNCWHFTKEYLRQCGLSGDVSMTIREALKYGMFQRNYSEFNDFIDKYIIKDDGTRNGVKVNLKEESNKNE